MSRECNKIDFGNIFSLALYSVLFANGFATVQNIASWKQNVGCLTQQNVNRTDVFADPTLKELGIMFFSLCLHIIYLDVSENSGISSQIIHSSGLFRCSIIFTIHFRVFPPILETPIYPLNIYGSNMAHLCTTSPIRQPSTSAERAYRTHHQN